MSFGNDTIFRPCGLLMLIKLNYEIFNWPYRKIQGIIIIVTFRIVINIIETLISGYVKGDLRIITMCHDAEKGI